MIYLNNIMKKICITKMYLSKRNSFFGKTAEQDIIIADCRKINMNRGNRVSFLKCWVSWDGWVAFSIC